MKATAAWVVAMGLVLGCGPTLEQGDSAGGSMDGGTSNDSAESGASADESGSAGGQCSWEPVTLPGVSEAAPECAQFVSPEDVAPVVVRVFNEGEEVRYLVGPWQCTGQPIAIQDSAGQTFPDVCPSACEGSMVNECGCLAACWEPDTIAVHPGGSVDLAWAGFVWQEPIEIGEECATEACVGQCQLRVEPAAGPVEVSVGVGLELECGDACGCEPNAEGWCVVENGRPAEDWGAAVEVVTEVVDWPMPCPRVEVRLP